MAADKDKAVTKTVLIYDQCGLEPIKFYVLEGDYTHLNHVYINGSEDDEAKADELSSLMYGKDGQVKLKAKKGFPYKAVKAGAAVIVAGFLP